MTLYLSRVRWGKMLETVGVFTDQQTAYAAAKRYVEDGADVLCRKNVCSLVDNPKPVL